MKLRTKFSQLTIIKHYAHSYKCVHNGNKGKGKYVNTYQLEHSCIFAFQLMHIFESIRHEYDSNSHSYLEERR